jgi:hypothetical protein
MDEHGLMLGSQGNGLVVGPANQQKATKSAILTREWVSILETISATGTSIPPATIFKGSALQTTWFDLSYDGIPPTWLFASSDNAWTSNSIGLEWLNRLFIPITRPIEGPTEYRLLILDGHGSHTTDEFMLAALEARIQLLYLPAHSSHLLQPLDTGVFATLKRHYRQEVGDLLGLLDSSPIKKHRFIQLYIEARQRTFRPNILLSGWKAAGIYPWRPTKAIRSSQTRLIQPVTQVTPPKRTKQPIREPFITPKGHKDVYLSLQKLRTQGTIDRSTRRFIQKCNKKIE